MVVGECYKYDISTAGDTIEIKLYENRAGKEKAFEWGLAGEVIAKRIKKLNGVVDAYYSPTMGCLSVKISKDIEGLEAVVRVIMDIASEVLTKYKTPVGKAETILKEFGLEPA